MKTVIIRIMQMKNYICCGILLVAALLMESTISGQTAGNELVITPYTTTIFTGGKSHSQIMVRVVDSRARDITSFSQALMIKVTGDGSIIPDPEHKRDIRNPGQGTWETDIADGKSWFILVAGNTPAKLKVEVSTESMRPASTEIHSIMPFILMKPEKSQVIPTRVKIEKMIGADISFLPQLEDRGMKFSDNGIQKDALEILKDHGFNYIRLRIFNNPSTAKGYSPGKGFCDLEHTKQMALRIKAAGLKLLLDFHYSDYWADPQQQNKPSEWDGLEGKDLEKALRDYTGKVISELKAQGTPPEMVQIGNEINHGFVWPDGHIGNPDELAALIRAGIEGVKEAHPAAIIMIHLALGGQNSESVFWLDNMITRGVDFDILGLSYYPRWHGTLQDLKSNMNDLIKRYGKDINLVEYSQMKEELNDLVFSLPGGKGKGTCIWEPLSTWEMIFDRQGKSNDLIKVYDSIASKYLK